jgi:cytoskeletal protein CcmA (bactofilin family)
VSFLRNTGQGQAANEAMPPARPRFNQPVEQAAPAENLLTQVRPEEPREVAREAHREAPREPLAFERDARAIPTPPDKCVNVIAAGSRWKGTLNVPDSVRIDGHVSGEVDAKGTVHISEGAVVEAKVKAAFVVICGAFKGELRCLERLELLPKSKVQGDLVTKVLNVHEGAVIDGSIRMSAEKSGEARGDEEAAREPVSNGARSGRNPAS